MKCKRLNLGCGMDIQEGYVNQDFSALPGVDDVFDFNIKTWPYKNNTFDEIRIKDCIECSTNVINFMNEVWRVSKPGAAIIIEGVNFLSPINCQDPFYSTHLGWNTFDLFIRENKKGYYDCAAAFEIISRRWVFSSNKYLTWISPLFNIFPKFYARFTYFWLPCNRIHFKLRAIK